ncbi:sensor histidine kinase [Nonomuraea ferruginea]
MENALSFSPRETRVTVSGSRIDGGGVMLSISDSGIGMTQEELVQANERLAQTVAVDVSVSRRMGLFVVSRLAQRHGIRVQLRTQSGGGLTAMVLVPESLLGAQTQGFDGAVGAAGALAEHAARQGRGLHLAAARAPVGRQRLPDEPGAPLVPGERGTQRLLARHQRAVAVQRRRLGRVAVRSARRRRVRHRRRVDPLARPRQLDERAGAADRAPRRPAADQEPGQPR